MRSQRAFYFTAAPTPETYTLSLHDALPICIVQQVEASQQPIVGELALQIRQRPGSVRGGNRPQPDRKSTRLNSSHVEISYAVFCLKKKNNDNHPGACR